MFKITNSYLLVMLVCLHTGCTRDKDKYQLFKEQFKEVRKTEAYRQVQATANKDLNHWLSAGLAEVQVLRESNWKVDDAVFFNSKKNRCYLLLILQDKDQNADLDYVYVMYGALENNRWNIYYLSFPSMVFPREQITKSKHIPVPLATLSRLSEEEVINGYYNNNGVINDAYIDDAYTPDVIARHKLFLKKADVQKP